ncbi:MAG: tetratricopeptide repeat protein [Verrucomicrobiota bacterium]
MAQKNSGGLGSHLYFRSPQEILQEGMTLYQNGNVVCAVEVFQDGCKRYPKNADLWMTLGVILKNSGELQSAKVCLYRSLKLSPSNPGIYNNLGNLYQKIDDTDQAESFYRKAHLLDPENVDFALNLGRHLLRTNNEQEGMTLLEQLATQNQDVFRVHQALGLARLQHLDMRGAEKSFRKVIELNPNYAEGWANLGSALVNQKKHQEALKILSKATELDELLPQPQWNKAIVQLREGNWYEGWQWHEWRRKLPGYREHVQSKDKEWSGQKDKKATLLVRAEQGFGDTIQFIRFGVLLKERVGRVVLECQDELMHLCQCCEGFDEVISRSDNYQNYDYELPLLSIPGLLKITQREIPHKTPYIVPRDVEGPVKVKNATKFNVGLVWRGSSTHQQDKLRSCDLREYLELLSVEGADFYSLQKDSSDEEKSILHAHGIIDCDQKLKSFKDTVSLIKQLDLVISVDTAVAHLAGAIGTPVWNLIQFAPDWRWMLERSDTPWYPTMRLFRQSSLLDWCSTVSEIKHQLHKSVEEKS